MLVPCIASVLLFISAATRPFAVFNAKTDLADLVNVLAGTTRASISLPSNGNTLPQIKRPFGFNDWVPETRKSKEPWWFDADDQSFSGIRCTHQPSPWLGDYATFSLLPHVGEASEELGYSSQASTFRPYFFSTGLQEAAPSFLFLKKSMPINFEFVPTSRAAIGRVTFPESVDVGRISVKVPEGVLRRNGATLSGKASLKPPEGVPQDWQGLHLVVRTQPEASGVDCRGGGKTTCVLQFSKPTRPVIVHIGTSFISTEQAEHNLRQEIGSKSLDDVADEGKAEWNGVLRRVDIDALNEDQLHVFYTNLWKANLFPRYTHEIDLQGNVVHLSPYTGNVSAGTMVTDSGFWDSYRTVYPLQSVIYPENFGKLIDGWVNSYQEAGWVPQWASPGGRYVMVSTMSDVSMADAIAKKKWGVVGGFDETAAYAAMRRNAFEEPTEEHVGRIGLREYIRKGYLPSSFDQSVSISLNYYTADAAISRAAKVLGKMDDHKSLLARSLSYPSLFNNDTLFFQEKNTGNEFDGSFDPLAWGVGFTEAGAWQYRFAVPHDVDGLNALYRGRICDHVQDMLGFKSEDNFHVGSYGHPIHEMVEMEATKKAFGLYAHNNQPVHDVLWIAKKAGCDELADKYLRNVLQNLYTRNGWSGDEDNGEMASWYVLSALGMYSLEGAKDEMVIGSPAIRSANILLPGGNSLKIQTLHQSETNLYVKEVSWSAVGASPQRLHCNVIKYTDLMKGGTLSFVMSDVPRSDSRIQC